MYRPAIRTGMASDAALTMAMDVVDRTQPIVDGTIEFEGIESNVLTLPAPERHRRMLKFEEFDVCELSLGSYLAAVDRGCDFTAIPAFPHRVFRHGYYFVNTDAGIDDPADLEGARVGLRRWQNTAGVWMRGILEEYHGVDLERIEWVIDDEDEIPVEIPDRYEVERVSEGRDVNDLLVDGDIDALAYPRKPTAYRNGHPRVALLFPAPAEVDRAYYRDTGVFPLMHVVVVADEVIEEYPWVPTSLRKGFAEANRTATTALTSMVEGRQSLTWAQEQLSDDDGGYDIAGTERELWTDDVDRLLEQLAPLIEYAERDGLIADRIDPRELFVESALERLPRAV